MLFKWHQRAKATVNGGRLIHAQVPFVFLSTTTFISFHFIRAPVFLSSHKNNERNIKNLIYYNLKAVEDGVCICVWWWCGYPEGSMEGRVYWCSIALAIVNGMKFSIVGILVQIQPTEQHKKIMKICSKRWYIQLTTNTLVGHVYRNHFHLRLNIAFRTHCLSPTWRNIMLAPAKICLYGPLPFQSHSS